MLCYQIIFVNVAKVKEIPEAKKDKCPNLVMLRTNTEFLSYVDALYQSQRYPSITLQRLDCKPENFLMVGNSRKSDILPVLAINAFAVEVPYHTTWIHEVHEEEIVHPNFIRVESIDQVIPLL